MCKLYVLGMGPGHPDYILPKVREIASECDVIIAGARHLSALNFCNERVVIDSNLSESLKKIQKALNEKKQVAVCVSGDPGFYSYLKFLKKNLKDATFEVIPGISSLSYLFSKIGKTYEDVYMTSLHGRDVDIRSLVKKHRLTAVLTDREHNVSTIAHALTNLNVRLTIGENLSYSNEKIVKLSQKEAKDYNSGSLCIVVIENEDL